MLNLKRIILRLNCLTLFFGGALVYGQETQTVLHPNQLVTFSLVPKQERVFVLQMEKGDFAEIQALQVIVFASFSRTVCLGTGAEIQRKQVRREAFALSRGQRPTEATQKRSA